MNQTVGTRIIPAQEVAETVLVQFGILDWEACETRFSLRPSADVYFDESHFKSRVIWYLAQGMYKIYYAPVAVRLTDQIGQCEAIWNGQGNNIEGEKFVTNERSFSMSDIVILSNGTVWVCIGKGWECLNPGVI